MLQNLNNSILVHVSSGIFNESSEAAILEEHLSGVLEELAKLAREVGDASSLLSARCDVFGGREELAVGVLHQGSKRAFRRAFERQYPLRLAADTKCFAVSSYELHTCFP